MRSGTGFFLLLAGSLVGACGVRSLAQRGSAEQTGAIEGRVFYPDGYPVFQARVTRFALETGMPPINEHGPRGPILIFAIGAGAVQADRVQRKRELPGLRNAALFTIPTNPCPGSRSRGGRQLAV